MGLTAANRVRCRYPCVAILPELRRHLELTVVPEADGHLTIRSCTLQTEPREPVPLLDDQSERSNEFITICSWCKKVEVEGE